MQKKQTSLNNRTFRVGRVNPVEMMTLSSAAVSLYRRNSDGEFILDFTSEKNIDAINTYYNMIFERIEVQINENLWKPVKEKDSNIWWPESIQDDYETLFALVNWFTTEVVFPVFMRSNESKTMSDSLEQQAEITKAANDKE